MLVVDDDPIVRDVLLRYLARAGLHAESAARRRRRGRRLRRRRPRLVVLDLMLPRIDGLEVFRRIRALDPSSAVIMLTARGQQTERIAGLESGADDYVAKPFSPREVVARVKTILRRVAAASRRRRADARARSSIGELRSTPGAHEVRLAGEIVALTPKEFELLAFLAASPRRAFSRGELLDELWDIAYDGDPSTVTVHVRRLREKIERDPSATRATWSRSGAPATGSIREPAARRYRARGGLVVGGGVARDRRRRGRARRRAMHAT